MTNVIDYIYSVEGDTIRFHVRQNAAFYYTLEASEDLQSFPPIRMSLGRDGPVWEYEIPLNSAQGFFRIKAINIFAAQDTDGDGIDDVYELGHTNTTATFSTCAPLAVQLS